MTSEELSDLQYKATQKWLAQVAYQGVAVEEEVVVSDDLTQLVEGEEKEHASFPAAEHMETSVIFIEEEGAPVDEQEVVEIQVPESEALGPESEPVSYIQIVHEVEGDTIAAEDQSGDQVSVIYQIDCPKPQSEVEVEEISSLTSNSDSVISSPKLHAKPEITSQAVESVVSTKAMEESQNKALPAVQAESEVEVVSVCLAKRNTKAAVMDNDPGQDGVKGQDRSGEHEVTIILPSSPEKPKPPKVKQGKIVKINPLTESYVENLGLKPVGKQEAKETNPTQDIIEIKPQLKVEKREQEVKQEVFASGRPKRKASSGVAAITRELNRRKRPREISPKEEKAPVPPKAPTEGARRRGRPPKDKSGASQKIEKENKENCAAVIDQKQVQHPVTINIVVKDKSLLPYVNNMGIHIMYYCQNCTFYGRNLMNVAKHIAQCSKKPAASGACPETLSTAALEHAAVKDILRTETDGQAVEDGGKECEDQSRMDDVKKDSRAQNEEHNYATAEIHFECEEEESNIEEVEDLTNDEEKQSKERKPVNVEHLPATRKWFCSECHYTVFYSEVEFEIHKKCHGKSGSMALHCYLCRVKKRDDWHRLKVHLHRAHKLNFKLKCDKCDQLFTSHATFYKHCRTHKCKCKYKFCKFESHLQSDIEVHEKCHMEKNNKHFKCYICGYQCKLRPGKWSTMHSHFVTKHHGLIEPLYKCELCTKGFQELRRYSDHVKLCSKGIRYRWKEQCKICGKNIISSTMESHLKTHLSDAESIERVEAEKESGIVEERASPDVQEVEGESANGDPQEPSERVEDPDETEEVESRTYKCQKHWLEFPSQDELTKHLVEVHWGVTPEKVQEARVQKEKVKQLMQEVQSKKLTKTSDKPAEVDDAVPGTSDQNEQKTLEDETVDETMTSKDGAEDVEKEVEKLSSVICKDCGKEFPTPSRFRHHYRVAHASIKRLGPLPLTERCPHCYKKFSNPSRLANHIIRLHNPEKMKPVLCQLCGREFRNKNQFRNHYRVVHEGKKRKKTDRPYKRPDRKYYICETCGYTTPEAIRLRNHQLAIHEGIAPYQCDICDYKTSEKSDMRRHKQKHLGIKRHQCHFCNYRTNQRWLLVNHAVKQHGIQLPKINRDTRGCYWSNRRKSEKVETLKLEPVDSMEIDTEQGHVIAILPEHIQDTEAFARALAEHAGQAGMEEALREQHVAVETINQAELDASEVVYVHEDGSILEPEEAALMLLGVMDVQVQS